MRRLMTKERAREIADNPGTSIVSDTRRALLWALDELSARDGEIISLKARIAALASRPRLEDTAVHRCPAIASAVTPCCNRVVFELPRTDCITVDDALVTCRGRYGN